MILRFGRMATSRLFVDPDYLAEAEKDDWAKCVHRGLSNPQGTDIWDPTLSAFARIENHYFINAVRFHKASWLRQD